jgi:hypothetical protein
MNDLLSEAGYVALHVDAAGPSPVAEKNRSPLIVSDTSRRFQLSDDIWIEKLDQQLAIRIQQACDPPNYNISFEPYDRHLYAFAGRVSGNEGSNYAGMSDLHTTIALSRLVHPTSTGDRYCVKVLHFGMNGSAIQAVRYRGVSPDVSLAAHQPDWLSVEDGEVLRELMPWLSKIMHPRVHRAYWNHEYAMRSYYLDMRWTLVVSGLEALTNVGQDDCAGQFRNRVRQLAVQFSIDLSEDELRGAYKLRSKLLHAEGFLADLQTVLPKSQHSLLYEKLELLLRATVRHCLLDQTFGDCFRDGAAVKARYP